MLMAYSAQEQRLLDKLKAVQAKLKRIKGALLPAEGEKDIVS
ncbi:hypothetical protein [Leclercia sp. UBA2479]|nr:hypothetical protein [Leclercia sp. UBA2479]